MTIDLFAKMMASALAAVKARKDELSALDGATGDGDHGIAICEAMGASVKAINPAVGLKQSLNDMGMGVMMATSGSISTLLGALWLGMSDGVDTDNPAPAEIAAMFASGLANVRKQTKAGVGDKTMMDALIPAVAALQAAVPEGTAVMFERAAVAADAGCAATKTMVAKFGRARNLGDRVIGHQDAGATSIACIFRAFADKTKN